MSTLRTNALDYDSIGDYIEALRNRGVLEPSDNILVTNTPVRVTPTTIPWYCVRVVNYGTKSVSVFVNSGKSTGPHVMPAKEVYKIDVVDPLLVDVLLWTPNPGDTSIVSVIGTR